LDGREVKAASYIAGKTEKPVRALSILLSWDCPPVWSLTSDGAMPSPPARYAQEEQG
jgi:hypothetical protein